MSEAARPLRVAVIGAGPAGIYTADILTKSEEVRTGAVEVAIDIFDRYPAPFGLIRYGVAPDHPRIKGIITALHKVLDRGDIRFFGNVEYGKDLTLADLREHYDAIIFATGAIFDAPLNIKGIDLDGSYGAADFVSWYDGHPDYPRTWPLEAEQVAVLGNGNVALDVSRILSKHADDLLVTEIPDNVYEGLKASPVTDVHVFGRRGPAQMKFTPLELRELAHSRDVDIVLYEEDFQFDAASEEAMEKNAQTKVMMKTLRGWLEDQKTNEQTASRRLHLHFLQSPHEILGEDGKVVGLRMERNKLDGNGGIIGTGEYVDYPVQAVYRAIGYFGSELLLGLYASGWIKRGPVGLIGSTKSDALETITHLLEDRENLYTAPEPEAEAFSAYLDSKGIKYTTWEGWHRLDDHEKALGAASKDAAGEPRARVKVVDRDEMVNISRGE
ncbi:MAG: FAD-dependent oxidoreductase [Rothia mucilaginosa]|uniref:FAD-dependent oxidoreductase n=1 Tax=Rothia mucilaginosa TaxID=43675 RepID=UPI0026EAA6D8|nr:FAD-dependent oxidoreductase [Rothia mucilaginosa]MBS4941376.1 FAD-dependent oxidoreductase [Rothia mucilaginosa]